jgi:hypothetical protein
MAREMREREKEREREKNSVCSAKHGAKWEILFASHTSNKGSINKIYR